MWGKRVAPARDSSQPGRAPLSRVVAALVALSALLGAFLVIAGALAAPAVAHPHPARAPHSLGAASPVATAPRADVAGVAVGPDETGRSAVPSVSGSVTVPDSDAVGTSADTGANVRWTLCGSILLLVGGSALLLLIARRD